MRNGVDEGVMLLIAPDLAHQKKRVEHYAAQDNGEQEDTQKKQDSSAPVKQDPADVEEKNDGDQPGAQSNEKRDRPAPAGKYHILSLSSGEAGCIPKTEVLGL
jgi:hypothetical protein